MNTLHDSDEQKLRDIYLKVRNMRGGPGVRVHHERDSVVVSLMPRRRVKAAQQPGTDVTVRITEPYAGGGKYAGVILFAPAAAVATTGTLADADLGSATDAPTCLIINSPEVGKGTHVLNDGSTWNGRIVRRNADGAAVVEINGFDDLMLAVTVTADGGVAGDSATTCTKTYTVKNLAGDTLGTTKTPKRPRYANCEYDVPTADSPGMAYYDAGGTLQLYEAVLEKVKGDVITVQTDYRIDTGTKKFQKKTRSVLVLETAAESDWVDVHTGTACPSP